MLLGYVLGRPLTENLGVGALGGIGRLLVLLSGLLIGAITLRSFWRRTWSASRLPLEFSAVTLVILLTMRITWVHSLTPMLFAWPFLMCWGAAGLEHGKRWSVPVILVGCFGFFLAVAHLPILWGERWLTWPWLLAPGLHTVGLLLLWGTSVFLLGQRTTAQRKPTTPRLT